MSPELIKDRAQMLARARQFFHDKNVLEVDPPALVRAAPNDSNIDVIQTDQEKAFLHTSPEYAMKRLLAAGLGDCYFLGHVYRKGEVGRRHNPEFTMAEWYRCGFSLQQMIEETADFLALFFGPKKLELISYKDAFAKYGKEDGCNPSWDKETRTHYILTHHVEPHLGINCLTALIDFPPEEAALACTIEKDGEIVAERFEIYHEGIELANGYHELSDAEELRRRFMEKNRVRIREGKEPYSLDEPFLDAMKTLPDCSGVALGFDRALMLRHKLSSIKQVIPFPWEG